MTVRRTLEDLQALKLVHGQRIGQTDGWRLQDRWRTPLLDLLRRLHQVPRPAGTKGKRPAARRRRVAKTP
jgi:hypothetical protein